MILLSTTQTDAYEIKKISLGEEAPYSGVLVPIEDFMSQESDLKACSYLADHPSPCEEETDYKGMVTVGMFSFSLGALSMLLIKK